MNINIVLVVVLLILAVSACNGYKKGMLQEVISIISLIFAVFVFALVATAFNNFISKEYMYVVMAILFIVALVIVFQITKIIVIPARILSKLPIISFINKVCGFLLGMAEGVIFIWFVFLLLDVLSFSSISRYILDTIQENTFLIYLYEQNLLNSFLK